MQRMFPVTLASAGLLAAFSVSPARPTEAYHWVQYTASGLEARAISDGPACPPATIEGIDVAMSVRATPGENYPVTVCSLALPKGVTRATISAVPLALPKPRIDRILLIGDTGCRLKGDLAQACNDPNEWPFRLGADVSASMKPDLVLHVGDFHYRESACPLANSGCAGTPFGDSWDVWRADFFIPGDTLLKVAPWIMVRGNHEECERGGKGWARTLDGYAFDPASGMTGCLGLAQPYKVDIGGLTIVVMDVSSASERVNEKQVAFFRDQFAMAKDIPGPVWLAFHRPVWAMDNVKNGVGSGDNKTLAAAAKGAVPANVQSFLSGHLHTFMAMSYVEDLPSQIVSGHGGDELSPNAPTKVIGIQVNNVNIKGGIGHPLVYGFSLLERDPDDATGLKWTLTGLDSRGNPFAKCRIEARAVACE